MPAEDQDFTAYQGADIDIPFVDIYDTAKNRLIQIETITEAWWAFGPYEDRFGEASVVISTDPARDYNNIGSSIALVEDGQILVSISGETMADILPGFYTHELRIINGGREYPLARGKILVKSKIAAV